MKRLLAIVPFLALLYLSPGAAHAVPRLPCTGTLTEHTGGCKVLTFQYKDGYVPTGVYDAASFPQTLFSTDGSKPECGWQQDLVQDTAVLPKDGILTSPSYFADNGWLVDAAHSPAGTTACSTIVTTTTAPATTTTVPATTVPPTTAPATTAPTTAPTTLPVTATTEPEQALARTGSSDLPLTIVALGLLGGGVVLVAAARRRTRV